MDFVCRFFFSFKTIGFFTIYQDALGIFKEPLKLEYIFGNISFIVLFIAVLLYWFDFSDTKYASKKLKSLCMIGANLSLTFLLAVRWWESGHFPLSNLYESLIGLSWSFTTVHLIVTFAASTFMGTKSTIDEDSKRENDKIGVITAPTALLTSVFATFFLPPEMQRATTLIPALKSNWLTMHVTVMVASYAFLLVGSLLSIALCAYKFSTKFFKSPSLALEGKSVSRRSLDNFLRLQGQVTPKVSEDGSMAPLGGRAFDAHKFYEVGKNQLSEKRYQQLEHNSLKKQNNLIFEKSPQLQALDGLTLSVAQMQLEQEKIESNVCIWLNTMSYRVLGLGFPLLTIGILSGAVWANEAWGSYWSWDPKETWALITWLVFAIYFHSRYSRTSDSSIIPASIASIGFIVIWICYLGVNLLQSGLHSYGWFA